MAGSVNALDLSVGWTSDNPILSKVSLHLTTGVHCVIGPNGSGKTTLIRTLAGIIPPLEGSVEVSGRIGYCSHRPGIYSQLTVEENLRQWASFLDPEGISSQAKLLENFHLKEIGKKAASKLSQGQRQRLGLARAFLGDPDVLFLDEPTAGLDPTMKRSTQEIIRKAGHLSCVVISSHDLLEVSGIATNIVHISASSQVTHEASSVVAARENRRVRIAVDPQNAEAAVNLLVAGNAVLSSSGWISVDLSSKFSIANVVSLLEEHSIPINSIDDLEGLEGYYKG